MQIPSAEHFVDAPPAPPMSTEVPTPQDWQSGAPRAEVIRPRPAFVSPQDRLEAIYVGHIAKDLSDELLKKILLQCGNIVRWTRSRDPLADAPTSFGFCEFETPEAVWRVTRLIDGLELGGSKLIVTCPQKTKELMEKWHSQRLFFLQKANSHWSSDQVEEEFAHDDERVMTIINKIVEDVEDAIRKNRLEREAEEKAKQERLAAVKARLNDKRDSAGGQTNNAKRMRMADGSSKSTKAGFDQEDRRKKKPPQGKIPPHLAAKQQHRIEAVQQRRTEMNADFERKAAHWKDELQRILSEGPKKWRRFEEMMASTLPSRRQALRMIEADLREVNFVLSLTYLDTLGRSVLYDFPGQALTDGASRKDVDEDDVPRSRSWQKKVLSERKRMRDIERRDDANDIRELETEESTLAAKAERREKVKQRIQRKLEEAENAAVADSQEVPSLEDPQPPSPCQFPAPSDPTPPIVEDPKPSSIPNAEIDWLKLKDSGYFDQQGAFRVWLVERMTDFVGSEDADELADFVLDFFPPKASAVPTRASLTAELSDFLDEETPGFVVALFDKLAQA